MAHSSWCSKSCSKCSEIGSLDESMTCSPDCDVRPEYMKIPEEVNIKRVMENIAAIGMMAGVMIAEGQFYTGDSTKLHDGIVRMGFEFERTYSDEDIDYDYIGMIDEFARKQLLEYYGIDE